MPLFAVSVVAFDEAHFLDTCSVEARVRSAGHYTSIVIELVANTSETAIPNRMIRIAHACMVGWSISFLCSVSLRTEGMDATYGKYAERQSHLVESNRISNNSKLM